MNEEISNFLREQAGERFLRYVRINTQSDPGSKMHPSSEGQWVLGRLLSEELIELGLSDVELDAHCYVYMVLPRTSLMQELKHSCRNRFPLHLLPRN